MVTQCSPLAAFKDFGGRLNSAAVRSVAIIAGSLALVLGIGSNAYALSNSQLCPPRHTGGGPPGSNTGDPTKDGSCNRAVFEGAPSGSVMKTTTAGPNNSVVSPGEVITVTLTWDKRDFGWFGPGESEDCVWIGNSVSRLSQEDGRAPLTGTDTFTYKVPADTGGQQICDRGVVWGYGATGGGWNSYGRGDGHEDHNGHGPQKSVVLCYSVLGAATPEAPSVIFLPLAALLVGGTGYVVARRRRTSTPLHRARGMSLGLRSPARHRASPAKVTP